MKKIINICLSLFLLILLFLNVFVSKDISLVLELVILLIFLILNIIINRYKGNDFRYIKNILSLIISTSFLIIGLLYIFSIKKGFSPNYNYVFSNYIKYPKWLLVLLIIIITELLRPIITRYKSNNKYFDFFIKIFYFLSYVIIDVSFIGKKYYFTSFKIVYEFISAVLIPSISKNILLNYLSFKSGYTLSIVYRLIIDMYIYFIPVLPRSSLFIESVILLIFPIILMLYIRKNYYNTEFNYKISIDKKNRFLNYISYVFIGTIIILVSREFKYSMIGVGSGSMSGTINKGDAIIYEKYDNESNLNKGDIIVFSKNGILIVHRIVDMYQLDNDYVYQTKGDANTSVDSWIVSKNEIVGVVNFRVILIAWPSVFIYETFS